MVRGAYFDWNNGIKKGLWDSDEDAILKAYVQKYGPKNWSQVRIRSGLARCGKSCRLRWVNYLDPDIRRGNFTPEEEDVIIRLHAQLGNRWANIAAELPGRTDHEIKNHWHAHLKKKTQRICMAANSNNNQQQYVETNSSSVRSCIMPNEGFLAESPYPAVIATATGIGHKDVPCSFAEASNTTPCLVNSYVDDDLGRCPQELSNLQVLNYEESLAPSPTAFSISDSDQHGVFSNQQGDFNNLDPVLLPFSYDYQYHPRLYTHYHNNHESAAYNGYSSAAQAPVVKPLPGLMSVPLHDESENPDKEVLYFKNPTESNNFDDAISDIPYQLNSSYLLPLPETLCI